jgi:hypothetical protein
MTPYEQKFLNHCIAMAKVDKSYAWSAAKRYAQMDPQLIDLPSNLVISMNALKGSNPSVTTTKSAETLQRLRVLKQQSGY